jgi:hypothetical protein
MKPKVIDVFYSSEGPAIAETIKTRVEGGWIYSQLAWNAEIACQSNPSISSVFVPDPIDLVTYVRQRDEDQCSYSSKSRNRKR